MCINFEIVQTLCQFSSASLAKSTVRESYEVLVQEERDVMQKQLPENAMDSLLIARSSEGNSVQEVKEVIQHQVFPMARV